MSKTYTASDLADLFAAIFAEMPDAVNPTRNDGHSCAYSRSDDEPQPVNAAPNCAVGTLATRMGWPLTPDSEGIAASTVADAMGWPVTPSGASYLATVQSVPHDGHAWGTLRLKELLFDSVAE